MTKLAALAVAAVFVTSHLSTAMSFQRAGRLARLGGRAIFVPTDHHGSPVSWGRPYTRRRLPTTSLLSAIEEEVNPGKVEGTDLEIVKYPHPALRAQNVDVTDDEIKDGSVAKLAKEMFLLMYATKGVGLAAPQVGVNKRLLVYNESGDSKRWLDEVIMVNPTIVEFSDARDVETEGCLSFPGMNGDVERSKWVKMEATKLNGKKMKKRFKGWEARIFQHEYDHLDGIVYVDRMAADERAKVQPRLDELAKEFGGGGVL